VGIEMVPDQENFDYSDKETNTPYHQIDVPVAATPDGPVTLYIGVYGSPFDVPNPTLAHFKLTGTHTHTHPSIPPLPLRPLGGGAHHDCTRSVAEPLLGSVPVTLQPWRVRCDLQATADGGDHDDDVASTTTALWFSCEARLGPSPHHQLHFPRGPSRRKRERAAGGRRGPGRGGQLE
jgi:hypothetical protein